MSADREIIVKPLGLVTQPNEKGQYPSGAMRVCQNLIMRSPGELRVLFEAQSYAGSNNVAAYGMFSTRSQLLWITRGLSSNWGNLWATSANALSFGTDPPLTATQAFSTTGRMQHIQMRDRSIVNAETCEPIVWDYDNPTTTAQRTGRLTGLPQVQVDVDQNNDPGNALDEDKAVSYAAHAERRFDDGYTVIGPMSLFNVRVYQNPLLPPTTGLVSYNVNVRLPDELVAGDVIRVYRSQAVPVVNDQANPGTTVYLVREHVLTSSDVSLKRYRFTDTAQSSNVGDPLGGLGEEAYTNPGQQGLTASKVAPPVAACVCSFKGRAIYADLRFPASFKFAVRAGFGWLNESTPDLTVLENGVGSRRMVGDVTSGSNTVTGIDADIVSSVEIGQIFLKFVQDGTMDGNRKVTAKPSSTSITFSGAAATGTVSGHAYYAYDLIELNGTEFVAYPTSFAASQPFADQFRIVSTKPLNFAGAPADIDYKLVAQRYVPPATLSVRGTHGANYDPPIPEISETAKVIQPTRLKNKVMYSEDQQPEAVPEQNEFDVGAGEIYALAPTRDAIWCFASDGLWRISGTFARIDGFPDIRVDPVDQTLFLAAPRAWCVLRDAVYAYTNRGFVQITDLGVKPLSAGIIGDILPGAFWQERMTLLLTADEFFDEIYLVDNDYAGGPLRLTYSVRYNCWSTSTLFTPSVATYFRATNAVYWVDLSSITGTYMGTVYYVLPTQAAAEDSHTPIAAFQPIYGNRPDGLKQFIDATWMFSGRSSATLQVQGRFGSQSFQTAQLVDAYGEDYRATFGVNRNTPAISNSLQLALQRAAPATAHLVLSGVSVRYVSITEQQVTR